MQRSPTEKMIEGERINLNVATVRKVKIVLLERTVENSSEAYFFYFDVYYVMNYRK